MLYIRLDTKFYTVINRSFKFKVNDKFNSNHI